MDTRGCRSIGALERGWCPMAIASRRPRSALPTRMRKWAPSGGGAGVDPAAEVLYLFVVPGAVARHRPVGEPLVNRLGVGLTSSCEERSNAHDISSTSSGRNRGRMSASKLAKRAFKSPGLGPQTYQLEPARIASTMVTPRGSDGKPAAPPDVYARTGGTGHHRRARSAAAVCSRIAATIISQSSR